MIPVAPRPAPGNTSATAARRERDRVNKPALVRSETSIGGVRWTTEQGQSRASGVARATFGTVLFIAWGVLSVLWVYDAIYELAHGKPSPAITAVVAVLLMLVLAVMEGLEVVMIHDWNQLYPDRTAHDLAAWLAARQMFVAFIVVAATILAARDVDRHPIHLVYDQGRGQQDLQLDLDHAHGPVVHADPPEAHGRD